MFKNALIYRINETWVPPSAAALEAALEVGRFEECGPSQRSSCGWAEPRGEKNGPLLEVVGGQFILKMMRQTKVLPSQVVKEEVERRCEKIAEATGRKPGSREKRELKEEVEHELLAKAFTNKGATRVWINPEAKLLVVDASSASKADAIITALVHLMADLDSGFQVRGLYTKVSASSAMATWLSEKEAPFEFSVDRECELKSAGGDKAVVRYSRHTLDIQEVADHIAQGKLPTKLAMTYDDRVSFVLAEDLSLRKISIQTVKESGNKEKDAGFDGDVAILTGELTALVARLVEALGGELNVAGAGEVDESIGANAVADATSSARAPASEPCTTDVAATKTTIDGAAVAGDVAHAPWREMEADALV